MDAKELGREAAFPVPESYDSPGMDLRTYLAGKAPPMPPDMIHMAQEHADCDNPNKTHREKCEVLAQIWSIWATMHADALLEELAKDSPSTTGA